MKVRVIFSPHAKQRILQRGINEETIKEVILHPDHTLDTFLSRKIAVRKIGEYNWCVVYVKEENIIKVVTVYYE